MKDTKERPILPMYSLLPVRALREAAILMAKEVDNKGTSWTDTEITAHLDHAMEHIISYLMCEDVSEDHLVNATCRIMMACEKYLTNWDYVHKLRTS